MPRRWRGFGPLSIRQKLLVLVLLPLLVVLPLLGLVLLLWGDTALDRLLITKVRSDLAVANGYFERVQGEVRASLDPARGDLANAHARAVQIEPEPDLEVEPEPDNEPEQEDDILGVA